MTCSPNTGPTHFSGEYQSRIKDSEIYGAIIEDRVRVSSPTVAKNLGQIQRGFVIGVENVDPELEKNITLVIGNQPPGAPQTARASWRQLPFGPVFGPGDPLPILEQTVTIEPLSTEYVTLFVVSQNANAPVTVFAMDGTTVVSQITVNGQSEAGSLIDPGTTASSVLLAEIHDPGLIEPIWDELEINALNPNFRNPNFRNPNFRNLNTKNTDYMDPNLRNPDEQNPNFRNTTEEAPNLRNPNLRNPNLRNEGIVDSFIDVTYTVTSSNNTTTAVNADFAYGGEELDGLDVQVIAWEADELDSLQDCETGLITENKVISSRLLDPNLRNPNLRNLAPADIAEPFQGTVSFPLAPSGAVNVTLRIFCDLETCEDLTSNENGPPKLQELLGYNFWAQKANTGKTELNTDNEVIIKDVIPPAFDVENGHMFRAVAVGPSGAEVDITTGIGVIECGSNENPCWISADDNGEPTDVSCTLNLAGSPTMPGAVLVPLGTTGVTCTTQDTATPPNVGTWTGSIRVEDHTLPVLTLPASPITQTATSAAGAIVNYVATATDAIDPSVTVSCNPPSGSQFPIGNTTVTCTATDDGPNALGVGNQATGTFVVTILPLFQYGTTGITIDKPNPKTGTSIPTFFAWTLNGVPQNVGAGNQVMRVTNGTCPGSGLAQAPGSSGFQLRPDNSWQWNFQAVDQNGNDLPATRSGTPYCLTVTLTTPLVPGGQSQSGVVVLKSN
jgi:hypothetical protein